MCIQDWGAYLPPAFYPKTLPCNPWCVLIRNYVGGDNTHALNLYHFPSEPYWREGHPAYPKLTVKYCIAFHSTKVGSSDPVPAHGRNLSEIVKGGFKVGKSYARRFQYHFRSGVCGKELMVDMVFKLCK